MSESLIEQIAVYLGWEKKQLIDLSIIAPKTYRHYKIPKKKGGLRTIHHPAKETKAIQYAIIELFLSKFPVHECAVAYRRNMKSPLQKNALNHASYAYTVRIDFKDFFHSIAPEDLFGLIDRKICHLNEEEYKFLQNSLFVKLPKNQMRLAIGAPSSPLISNIVMYMLDESIQTIANRISSKVSYSRYADDIIFSTNIRGGCKSFYTELKNLIEQTDSPKLVINTQKTLYSSRAGRRVVTGVFIQPDGGISLGRGNKRYIRKLLFDYKNKTIEKDKMNYLSGYLAFSLDVEPDFYNRLVLKYGAELLESALKS